MNSTLITDGIIVTMNPTREIINDGAIFIENGRIKQIGPTSQLTDIQADEIISARNKIIIPGLINAHTHAGYYMMRGLGMDMILLDWLHDLVWPWIGTMNEQDAYIASLVSYIECLKGGTTSLVDNQNYFVSHSSNYDAAARAAVKSKLRVTFACGFLDVQFIAPLGLISTPDKIEDENRRMITTWHDHGRIKVVVSPINLIYCSEESIQRSLQIMAETGVGMHTHVAESRKEFEAIKDRFGKGYIEAFHDMGALSNFFQSVHTVWISDNEIDLLAKAGASVMHNPTANMLLASGIAPVVKMQAAGVNVALGTDNPNNNNDMLEAMKFASLAGKVSTLDPLATPAIYALEMATINGARALHQENEIGSLEVGKRADIVFVDTRRLHNIPFYDPVTTLVYSANDSDVTHVMVEGDFLVRDGKVLILDEQELIEECQQRGQDLDRRIKAQFGTPAKMDKS